MVGAVEPLPGVQVARLPVRDPRDIDPDHRVGSAAPVPVARCGYPHVRSAHKGAAVRVDSGMGISLAMVNRVDLLYEPLEGLVAFFRRSFRRML